MGDRDISEDLSVDATFTYKLFRAECVKYRGRRYKDLRFAKE